MEAQRGADYIAPPKMFDVTQEFITIIKKGIKRAQKGKSEGKNDLFVELMKLYPTNFARLSGNIWKNMERKDVSQTHDKRWYSSPYTRKGKRGTQEAIDPKQSCCFPKSCGSSNR